MWRELFRLSPSSDRNLQRQLREQLVAAILDGHLPIDHALPSSRELARQLGVARNTVVLAYQHLVDEGFLIARQRRGYFVNRDMLRGRVAADRGDIESPAPKRAAAIDWPSRYRFVPSRQRNIHKPANWEQFQYPFVYGQPDPALIPVADWRDCARQALSVGSIRESARDRVDADDPLLVEQIQTRLLTRRGIWVSTDEILVTLGAQHALYLLASLLVSERDTVGIEDPGYPDARNIFLRHTSRVVCLPVDESGVRVDDAMAACDYVYVTPSHQAPTTVTLASDRRAMLLDQAAADDFLIIEDDYEAETNFASEPTPALKASDRGGRVIYIGSLSKTLAPGLRVGFMVGPPDLIREARALRRLMVRHPPSNNQRMVALFLSLGHHDALINRLTQSYGERWQAMADSLERHLPETHAMPAFGGTSVWVRGPRGLDCNELYERALTRSILIERGNVYFCSSRPPGNYFRLGYSSIPVDRIEPGIRELAALVQAAVA